MVRNASVLRGVVMAARCYHTPRRPPAVSTYAPALVLPSERGRGASGQGSRDHAARVRCSGAAGLHPGAPRIRCPLEGTGLFDPSRPPLAPAPPVTRNVAHSTGGIVGAWREAERDRGHSGGYSAVYARVTPVLEVNGKEFGLADFPIVLKLELFQHSGSFKARGAFANLADPQDSAGGGRRCVRRKSRSRSGVRRHAARRAGQGLRADRVVGGEGGGAFARTEPISPSPVIGMRRRLAASEAWVARTAALPVHAFDQTETLPARGHSAWNSPSRPRSTRRRCRLVAEALSAGWRARFAGSVKVVGVEPELAPTLTEALKAGRPVDAPAGGIAADSLAPLDASASGCFRSRAPTSPAWCS